MSDTRLAYTTGPDTDERLSGGSDYTPPPETPKVIRKPRIKKHQPRYTSRGPDSKLVRAGDGALRSIKVRRDVWREAMRLAKGDGLRLVVRAADIVTVANSREHAKALGRLA